MDHSDYIQKMIYEFNFIENLYECIRLVNPMKKEVFKIIKGPNEFMNAKDICYVFWKSNRVCENCISIRACHHNKTITKIEYNEESLYIVTAVPIRQYELVIEFLQNISSDYLDQHNKNFYDIIKLIQKQNLSVVKNVLSNIHKDQFIYERLPYDIASSYEEGTPIALFMIKVKDIRMINNKFGFPTGDQAIEEVAKSLKTLSLHQKDWLSSYRGTRFILVLHDINENQLGHICDRIYDRINRICLTVEGTVLKLEAGIGYHLLKDTLITPEQFIEKATEMLKAESNNDSSIHRLTQKYSLTYREREIALQLLKGKSNIEIANSLYIGLSTVKKHLSALYSKISVRSRAEFIAKLNSEEET